MSEPLYLDTPELEKEAGFSARLNENADNWPQELTSELYKQLPYLSDYAVDVKVDRVDNQRGFAMGYADVSSKTTRPEEEHTDAGIPHVRIPLVVEERQVRPFSVFMDGERVMPLTEDRMRTTLFNPNAFDLSNTQPLDPSIAENLSAPRRAESFSKLASMVDADHDESHLRRRRNIGTAIGAGAGGAVAAGASVTANKILARHHAKKALVKKLLSRGPKSLQGKALAGTILSGVGLGALQGRDAAVDYHLHKRRTGASQAEHPAFPGEHEKQAMPMQMPGMKMPTPAGAGAAMKMPGFKAPAPKVPSPMPSPKPMAVTATPGVGGTVKSASILRDIAHTIPAREAQAFISKVASSPLLQAGFRRSGIGETLVDVYEKTKRASSDQRLTALAEGILPTVTTLYRLPGGDFIVKQANVDAFAGGPAAQGQVVPQEQMAEQMPAAMGMQPGQSATMTSMPSPMAGAPAVSKAKPIDEFGEYKVQDAMGNYLMGWVFPKVLNWGDFQEAPIAVFTNGSAYAVQDQIVGELVGKGTNLPVDATPRGDGVFYKVTGGEAICTAPVTIGSSMAGPDGQPKFQGSDVFGNPVVVGMMEGLKGPQRVSDTEYAVPSDWSFMRLNNQTQLLQQQEQYGMMGKMAGIQREMSSATLLFNGSFHLQGGCGLNKLAHEMRTDMDHVHAEFMLGLLGLDGHTAKQKVAQARSKGVVKLAGLYTITTLGERYEASKKTAAAVLSKVPNLRKDLVKEASQLEDEGTVDKVLALNHINSENLGAFIERIPEFEETSEKLAEMLLSGYLGLKEVPVAAIERSMKGIEEVLQGLKSVQFAEV